MMNRSEFMFVLAQKLADLPFEERSEALKFYNNYFDDAGPENEQRIIDELVSPEHVAASIRAGLDGSAGKGEFREDGYHETYEQPSEKPAYQVNAGNSRNAEGSQNAGNSRNAEDSQPEESSHKAERSGYTTSSGYTSDQSSQNDDNRNAYSQNYQNGYEQDAYSQNHQNGYEQNTYGGNYQNGYEQDTYGQDHYGQAGYDQNHDWNSAGNGQRMKNRRRPGRTVWIVILCICAAPVIIGLAGGLFGGVIGLLAGLFGGIIGIIASLFGGVLGGIIGGIWQFVKGLFTLFTSPADGLAMCGTGLLGIAAGLLLLMLLVWFCSKAVPAIIRWLKRIAGRIKGRRRRV